MKLEKVENNIIGKYTYKNYVVYIKAIKNSLEAYLQNEEYGIIDCMFGIEDGAGQYAVLLDLVEDNIEDYIKLYKEEHEEEVQ